MFIIKEFYRAENFAKETHETADEAISKALEEAETDNEGYTYVVCEVHTVLKARPPKHPVNIYDAVQAQTLIENKKDGDNS